MKRPLKVSYVVMLRQEHWDQLVKFARATGFRLDDTDNDEAAMSPIEARTDYLRYMERVANLALDICTDAADRIVGYMNNRKENG